MIIDGRGKSKEIGFKYGSGTEVFNSCSIVWRGQMVVFGGDKYRRQISVVEECKLTKIGKLAFPMKNGACAQRDDVEIFICFENRKDSSTWKNCRRSTGPLETFSKLPSSNYDHRSTRIAVTSGKLWKLSTLQLFLEYLVAVGSFKPYNVKTELLSQSNSWSVEDDYPFTDGSYGTEYLQV